MITPTTTTYSNDHPSECLRECPRKCVSIDSDRVKPLIHTAEVSIFVFGCEISKHKISNEAIERTRAILRFLFTVLPYFLVLFLPPNIKLELKTYSIRSMHLKIVEIWRMKIQRKGKKEHLNSFFFSLSNTRTQASDARGTQKPYIDKTRKAQSPEKVTTQRE